MGVASPRAAACVWTLLDVRQLSGKEKEMVAAGSTRRERWRQAQPLENKNTIWYLCMGCDSPQNNSMASPFWDWIAARWAVRKSNPRNRIPTPLSQQNHQATTTELQTKATLVTGSPQNAVFYNKCTPVKEPALQSLSAAHTEASAQAQQKHCGDHTANSCGLLCRTPTRY